MNSTNTDKFKTVMPKEVCCHNWAQLFDYLDKAPGLPNGLSGQAAVDALLDGLVDGNEHIIQDPFNPNRSYPVQEAHLRNPRYWLSLDFAYQLFARAADIIGGYRPLYHAGLYAGYQWMESVQPRHFQVLRFLPISVMLRFTNLIGNRFNRVSTVRTTQHENGCATIVINHFDAYKDKLFAHVCDWNAGIATGMANYCGPHDVTLVEKQCTVRGAENCIFELRWSHTPYFRKLLIFFHSLLDPDYIRDRDLDNLLLNDLVTRQDGIIADKASQQIQMQTELAEVEKRLIEQRITGGFAHEMGNALTGAQLQVQSFLQQGSKETKTAKAINLAAVNVMKTVKSWHTTYDIPKEEIAANVVRELTAIDVFAKELDRAVVGVATDIERALSITRQIRDFAKLSEIRPGNKRINLSDLLRLLIQREKKRLDRGGINIKFKDDTAAELLADRNHMIFIFHNLFLNAIDALGEIPGDDKQLQLRLFRYAKPNGHLVIEIEDNGPGIHAKHLHEIFEPFFSTKGSAGTGLGLSIVRRMVAIYNGRIYVDSQPGIGSMFRVELPLNQ